MSSSFFMPLPVTAPKKRTPAIGSPLAVEKDMMVVSKTQTEIYTTFNTQMGVYLSKVKNNSSVISGLALQKDVVYLGLLSKSNPSVLGGFFNENSKIRIIALNCGNLEVNIKTGDCSDVESINYVIYFQFIRAVVNIFQSEIERNQILNNLLIEYLNYIFVKNLKLPVLNDKQLELLKFITGVMYYKFFYRYNEVLAIEKCESLIIKEYYDEFKPILKKSNVTKYDDIRDIIKLIVEFRISFDPPNQLLYNFLTGVKTLGVLLVTSDITNLIATAILSQYPSDHYSPLFINRISQQKIEKIIEPYYSKVEFQPYELK